MFSSTAATYGEPDVELITEDTPNAPVNTYGNSKLAIDRMLADEARAHGLAAVSLRYFNVGGRERAAGRGPQARDAPDPAGAAGRGRQARERRDLRHRLPDPGRHRGARLHPRRGPRRARTCWRWRRPCPGATTSTTSGAQRGYSVREVIETARAVTGREIVAVEEAAPRRRSAAAGGLQRARARRARAGRPRSRSRTWSATPGRGTRRTPTATEPRAAPAASRRAWR